MQLKTIDEYINANLDAGSRVFDHLGVEYIVPAENLSMHIEYNLLFSVKSGEFIDITKVLFPIGA